MKIAPLALATALSFAAQAQFATAQGGLSCANLDEAERELSLLLDTLEARGGVQENSSFDQRLGIAADTAIDFAMAEGDNQLISLANGMRTGWEIKDIDMYIDNGDGMIDIYSWLYNRDC
ncbi:MAG: hypothetical protein AAFZ04_02990 [Pseudomonadota bacterium]